MKKYFRPVKIGAASIILSITALLSYIAGMLRDRFIATNFGANAATDAYNAAFLIPDFIFNLFIAGALSAAFMPIFSDHLEKGQTKEATTLANTILTTITLLIIILSIIAYFATPALIPYAIGNIESSLTPQIIHMTRVMLISAIFFAISNTLGNILMTYKHFLSYSLSPVLYNLGIILGILLLKDQYGIYSAAYGVVIGAVLHLFIRLIDLRQTAYKFRIQFAVYSQSFKKILKLMWPRAISLMANQINLTSYGIVGIAMIEGGFSAFNYARNLQSVAVSLFGIAIATAAFPFINAAASQENKDSYSNHIQIAIQRILFFTIPSAIAVAILAEPIVAFILGGGAFQASEISLTAILLFAFALSIPFESLTHILTRAFYARKNTLTPMFISLISVGFMIFITTQIAPIYGIKWFAYGFSLGFLLHTIISISILAPNLKSWQMNRFLNSLIKTFIASAAMAAVLYFTPQLHIILQIILGSSVFLILSHFLKIEELQSLRLITNRIFKRS